MKTQGQISNNKELSRSYLKNRVSLKVMTFLTLEVFEQKFKQSKKFKPSLGRVLGKRIYKSSRS